MPVQEALHRDSAAVHRSTRLPRIQEQTDFCQLGQEQAVTRQGAGTGGPQGSEGFDGHTRASPFSPSGPSRGKRAGRTKRGQGRFHRDLNSDSWIQSPVCSPLHHGTLSGGAGGAAWGSLATGHLPSSACVQASRGVCGEELLPRVRQAHSMPLLQLGRLRKEVPELCRRRQALRLPLYALLSSRRELAARAGAGACTGGVVVSIAAFQAAGLGSIPSQRTFAPLAADLPLHLVFSQEGQDCPETYLGQTRGTGQQPL